TDEILRLGREITKKTGKRATCRNCLLNAEITIQSQRNRWKCGFQDEASSRTSFKNEIGLAGRMSQASESEMGMF
ncbi:MAG: hypothetical protein ABH879_10740, partial [archaeon]